ncbi:transcription factor Pcc1, partial [Cryphonectria parasitica EP155]
TLNVPFPTSRLSSIAMRALAVDKELSPLKKSLASGHRSPDAAAAAGGCVLRVHYKATTNRMLRVAVNSFMDSLALILEVMERLDVDVLEAQHAG